MRSQLFFHINILSENTMTSIRRKAYRTTVRVPTAYKTSLIG